VIAEIEAIPAKMFVDLNEEADDASVPLDSIAVEARGYADVARDLLVDHSPWHGSIQDRAAQAMLDPEVSALVVVGLVGMAKAHISRRRAASGVQA